MQGCGVARVLPFGRPLDPPLMNAAGTVKTPEQARRALRTPSPVVVLGSYTLAERTGNPGDNFHADGCWALNSLGLPSPAVETWSTWVGELGKEAHDLDKGVWVSVAGFGPGEWRRLVEVALSAGADAVEVNLGCPNVWAAGEQKPIVSYSPDETAEALAEVARAVSPESVVGVKLSPLVDPQLLATIDAAVAAAGFVRFVTAVNTVPNAFARRPDGTAAVHHGSHLGGLSGPALKPIALGQIVQHHEQLPDMPIVGVGGIDTGADLVDFLAAPVSATACQVATAYWRRGERAIVEILQDYALSATGD